MKKCWLATIVYDNIGQLVTNDPALALRLTSAALAAEPKNAAALAVRKQALERLLAASKNSNESGWLHAGLSKVEAAQR